MLGALDFAFFPHPCLAEHGQQDDPAAGGDPVGDADCIAVRMEAEFAELAVQLSRVGLAEQRASCCDQVDVEGGRGEPCRRQMLQPVSDFRLQLNGTQFIALML